jgi:NosR/NirI family nitrous oxide reductase transcriptional regulator
MRRTLGWLSAFMVFAGSIALAEQRFPPPDFTNHQLPATELPPAGAAASEYVALGALVVALGLAAYLALVRRSRRGLFLLSLASLAAFGFARKGCVCPVGAVQNVALALGNASYAIPLTTVGFFVLPLVVALFAGRVFCAAVCPLGALQELVAVRPQRVPRWLDEALGLIPYIYLGAAVAFAVSGTAFVVCRYDPLVGFFRLNASLSMVIYGSAVLVVGLFVGRPYCRYLCPYGALLRLISPLARRHVRIPPDKCIQCRLCEDVCPYGAIRTPTPAQPVDRRQSRRTLLAALVAVPLLVSCGAVLGSRMGVAMAQMQPTVRLAQRVHQEEQGLVEGTTDASDAFRRTGRASEALYLDAAAWTARFGRTATWLGAWIGLVLGAKLVQLSLRRRRMEFEPDHAGCVSCGRCFWYCPEEQKRLGILPLEAGIDRGDEETQSPLAEEVRG